MFNNAVVCVARIELLTLISKTAVYFFILVKKAGITDLRAMVSIPVTGTIIVTVLHITASFVCQHRCFKIKLCIVQIV